MKTIVPLPSFDRCVKKITVSDRKKLIEILEKFNQFLLTGELSPGLGFKKINHDKYEIRVNLQLRVVFKQTRDAVFLVLVGNHDDVRRYLKKYRNAYNEQEDILIARVKQARDNYKNGKGIPFDV